MTTDAAFLDEVSAFLNASDLPLIHTPGDLVQDSFVRFSTSEVASVSLLDSSSTDDGNASTMAEAITNNDVQTANLTTKREKEVLRKQRYQMRLKNERDTLRQMKSKLSLQLEELKRVRKRQKSCNRSNQDLPWRGLAIQQRQQRLLAETEQKQLQAAINVQASYIGKLRLALLDHSNVVTTSLEENVLVHCVLQ